MSAKPDNLIKTVFQSVLKDNGFLKKSDGWYYHEMDSCVMVANLQKSNYGEQYYINFGIWWNALGKVSYPKHYQCHVGCRIEELHPKSEKKVEQLLDLDAPHADRVGKLTILINGAINILRKGCATQKSLKEFIKTEKLLARKDLSKLLGIKVEED